MMRLVRILVGLVSLLGGLVLGVIAAILAYRLMILLYG
jgi:hypothetical protein